MGIQIKVICSECLKETFDYDAVFCERCVEELKNEIKTLSEENKRLLDEIDELKIRIEELGGENAD